MVSERAAINQISKTGGGYSLVYHHGLMLAAQGLYLRPGARVLDFGCGSGLTVYEYRDAGFDAYGFDLTDYVAYRDPKDTAYFRFSSASPDAGVADFRLKESDYAIDFPNNSFDFVFSNSVLEHVQNHNLALQEIARVLKPGGVSLHAFPARYRLIESHTFVPLGGFIDHLWWFRLWALLGIRNGFQHDLSPSQVAAANRHYSQTGVNYPSIRALLAQSQRYFTEVSLVPQLWTIGAFRHPMVRLRPFRWLYSRIGSVVLWLQN